LIAAALLVKDWQTAVMVVWELSSLIIKEAIAKREEKE
jgi:hypothetical protein